MKKLSYYRPAIAGFLIMMATALISTGLSFFVSPVSQALGVGRGSFTLYYSLMSIAGAFTSPALGKLAGKRGVRSLILFSGVWVCAGMWLFSVAGQLWMFYGVGFATGLMGSACSMLCANVILQKNYDSRAMSGLLGIVMAGSGVGGMVVSAVLPGLIERLGWRMGYRLEGVAWLVLCVLAACILGKEKRGNPTSAGKAAQAGELGMTQGQMLRMPKMYLLLVQIFVLAACCGILQQLPSLLGGMGFAGGTVSGMMSLMTAAMALGKIAQGALYSAVDVRLGGSITIAVFGVSMLLLSQPALVYPGLVLLAVGIGVYTTLMPLVTRKAFGSYNFAVAWGVIQLGGSAGSFVGTPTWGAIYDTFGSYHPALFGAAALLAGVLAVHLLVTRESARS